MAKIYKSEETHQRDLFGEPIKVLPLPKPRTGAKGLSITLNLTARRYNTSECQVFMVQKYSEPISKKLDKRTNQDKLGQRVQKGLTRRGKKTIRLISEQYQNLITGDHGYHGYNLFLTPTYRRIIPDDKTAKTHLDSLFKRLKRHVGKEDIHYLWVAERQKRGAIHFHIMTPEIIDTTDNVKIRKFKERIWFNRAWNEIVSSWALSKNIISEKQCKLWLSELRQNERYNINLCNYYYGKSTVKPLSPPKSKYLLTPNLGHTFSAGAYMSKYMSKENEKIIGGMFGASSESRKYLIPKMMIEKNMISNIEGNAIIKHIRHWLKLRNIYCQLYHVEWNDTYTLWTKNIYGVHEAYLDYVSKYGLGMKSTHPDLKFRYKDQSNIVSVQYRNCTDTVPKLYRNSSDTVPIQTQ